MIEFIIIVICILLNGVLAGSEAAFIAVNKGVLREKAKQGKRETKILLYLRENPEKTLSVIQIGITFVGAFAAAVGGAGAEEALSPWIKTTFNIGERASDYIAITLVVMAITYASVVIGELVPKTLGLRRPLFVSLKAAPALLLLSRIAYPIVLILEKSTKGIIHLFPKKHVIDESVSEDQVLSLDILSDANKQYVLNLVKLERTLAIDILIEWKEVTFVDFKQSKEEVEAVFISSGHTRLPVLKGQEVVGILNSKEFIAFQKIDQQDWRTIIRPILMIQETTPVLAALRLMQEKRTHMAIVYHEQQRTGIITIEGIIEEIVGDIYDENDDGAIQRILSRRLK